MKKLKVVCYIIGVSQIVLAALYLFAPSFFIEWQGLNVPAKDMNYPIAMFAARLLVYGVGMFVIAQEPVENRFWLNGMIAIQVIDLVAGIFYTTTGVVAFESSSVPMFNAALFIALMVVFRNPTANKVSHA
ncbi:hypothetical protein A9Q83_05655 [Alphaproteobacteria bacterium 46_93_T64]|nr:hypothetical protein A9Q83_05655 [Alphaproteobacteria bacterium 46_93_T64]